MYNRRGWRVNCSKFISASMEAPFHPASSAKCGGRTRVFKMAVKHLLGCSFAHLISLHLVVGEGIGRRFTLSGRIRVIMDFRVMKKGRAARLYSTRRPFPFEAACSY